MAKLIPKCDAGHVFAISFISTLIGDLCALSEDVASWAHPDVPADEDGSIPYAVFLDFRDDSVWVDSRIPSPEFYAIVGYCKLQGYRVTES